jgi:hypothetical protein
MDGASSTERPSSQLWCFIIVGSWSQGTGRRVVDECMCHWPSVRQHSPNSTCLHSNSSSYCPLQHLTAWRRRPTRTCEPSPCTKEWYHQH